MPSDPTAIVTAAHKRRELTRAKAIKTLRELALAGAPVTFADVARTAGVSRSWLYAQPDIRAEIQRLRDNARLAPTPPIPASQRATDASAQARINAAIQRNRALAEDNQRLRRQLAQALGEQRQAPRQPGQPRPLPARKDHGSATNGPCHQ